MASNRIWRNREEKIVILDSNAIMMLFEFHIDLDDELTKLIGRYKIIIPKPIYNELEFLSKEGKGKKRYNAKASLKYIERFETVEMDKINADDSILAIAKKTKGIVVTNDRELKKRLKNISIPVIFLRSKNKLEIV